MRQCQVEQKYNSKLQLEQIFNVDGIPIERSNKVSKKPLTVFVFQNSTAKHNGGVSVIDLFFATMVLWSSAHPYRLTEEGIASEYSEPQATACPSYPRFDPSTFTAAHKTLPCGSKAKVTNLSNMKSTIVTIVDRGPFVRGRIIDLSTASFGKLAPVSVGLIRVRVESVGKSHNQ